LWRQAYPRDPEPYAALNTIDTTLGRFEKALEEARLAFRVDPNNATTYLNLIISYTYLNRFDDARAVLKKAEEKKLSFDDWAYSLAFLTGDTGEMGRLLATANGNPVEEYLLALDSDTQVWSGRQEKARELMRQAINSGIRNDDKETAAALEA